LTGGGEIIGSVVHVATNSGELGAWWLVFKIGIVGMMAIVSPWVVGEIIDGFKIVVLFILREDCATTAVV